MTKRSIAELAKPYLEIVAGAVDGADWRDRATYGNWLAQTYYFVCHSTRLLTAAAARFRVDRDDLHYQLAGHVMEEKHHERLATGDMKAMGYSIDDFPELTSTKNLYRTPYYLIDREHPIAFYGYVYLLEMLSTFRGGKIMREAAEAFGEKSVKFLRLHVNEDEGHIRTYSDFIDALPEEEFRQVLEGVATTAHNYAQMVRDVRAASAASPGKGTKKAA
jgi:hypothetical protein